MARPSLITAGARLVRRLRAWRGRWLALAILIAVIPVAGLFSNSSIFVVRDHAMYFWPKHRWLRDTILSGQWPWWDPYVAGGQSAAADALLQIFFLPTLLLRLLLPEVLGYNIWVALPFPLGAAGTYMFARHALTRRGAGVAAIVFAVSGPVVSSGNFPNLSWSIAVLPWVLWATHRFVTTTTVRQFVLLATVVAAQILSGEPVSMVATMGLAVAFVVCCELDLRSALVESLRKLALVIAAMATGAALSAIQIVPLLHAANHSARKEANAGLFWSLHPGTLVESVAPYLYGDHLGWFIGSFPWMRALNVGREPFLFSVYFGVVVLAVAMVGLCTSRRRDGVFWGATFVIFVVFSFGGYTPVYPLVQKMIPLLRSFRYPPKYLMLSMLPLAMLAGAGWQALVTAAARRRALGASASLPAVSLAIAFAVVGYAATFAALMFPDLLVALVLRLAKWMNIAQIEIPNAVVWMVGLAEPQGWRLFLLSAGAALLVWVAAAGRRESRVAAWALLVLMCADLTVTSAWVNLMQPASDLGKADWIRTVEQHPSDRFYFGGRPRGGLDPTDIDAPGGATLPGAAAAFEVRTLLQAQIVTTSSPWHIRDALTYDLPNLFAVEYEHVVQRFEEATHAERLHFLSVAGVRYCVMPEPPRPWSQPLGEARWFKNMKLYECDPRASRVRVTPPWGVVETNLEKQIDYLFRTDFDARQMVVLSANPPAAVGTTGPPVASPYASLTRDEATYVEVAAGVGAEGGFLVLADTFDEDWHVDVDDRPAPLLRANAVYRGVRLVPGVHVVRFRYQPHKLLMGAMISGVTLVGLVGLALLAPRRQRAISSLQVPLSVASSPSGSEAAR